MNSRIKKYLLRGEDDTLDFKQAITNKNKIAKSIVSFANHKGGVLLIGVKDNKTIAGINPEEEMYMLEMIADFYCKPPLKLDMKTHQIGEKYILECMVPEGKDKPYFCKDEDEKWWVYIRVKDESLRASKVVMDFLKTQKNEKPTILNYTQNEKMLLDYLSDNHRITLSEFQKLVNISRRRATRILVTLLKYGVIRNHTHEKTEFYTLS
jgi:predicted HTH transcriptional regulator